VVGRFSSDAAEFLSLAATLDKLLPASSPLERAVFVDEEAGRFGRLSDPLL